MPVEAVLAIAGTCVVGATDALLSLRVLRAYRKARRPAHLVIVAGIASSFFAVLGSSIVFASIGMPELGASAWWTLARWTGFVGAALAYGFVGVFAAVALSREGRVRGLAWTALFALVGIAVVGVLTSAREIGTVATTSWALRIPFVALALGGSLYGVVASRSLTAAYEAARAAGREVDAVALMRMRTMGRGFALMAIGQAPLIGFAPGGRFDTSIGYACVALLMLGGLGFTLACVLTWATPSWLKTRWSEDSSRNRDVSSRVRSEGEAPLRFTRSGGGRASAPKNER